LVSRRSWKNVRHSSPNHSHQLSEPKLGLGVAEATFAPSIKVSNGGARPQAIREPMRAVMCRRRVDVVDGTPKERPERGF
jgi:hypothetical protein